MDRIEFIKRLPKSELHLHIEGTLEPELMFDLAKRNNIKLRFNSINEIKQAYQFSNLQDFLNIYYEGAGVLIHQQDFYDLTMEYLRRCTENNIVHTEIFFDPQTHTDRGIAFDTVVSGITDALADAEKRFGITSHIIMCFLRHLSEDAALETLAMALPYRHLIKGVGLDSAEAGNPPEKFRRVFQKAREEGFVTVAHAGEEGDPSYIWGALDLLMASRIDHGVRSIEDPALVERLVSEQIPLTVCPLSNLKLKVFENLKEHSIKRLFDRGVRVTINSDDPSYFGGYINQNFIEIAQALDLNNDELAAIAANSFEAAFISDQAKQQHLHNIRRLTNGTALKVTK